MNRIAQLLAFILTAAPLQSLSAQEFAYSFETQFDGTTFNYPSGLRFGPEGDDLYVLEHRGLIKMIPNYRAGADVSVFLDLSDRMSTDPAGELLGLAFHPDYIENGLFYVRYKLENPHRTLLSRFSRSDHDLFQADVNSEVILFEFETPGNAANHHGGDLAFGLDGYLYLSMGDGGTQYDVAGRAQSLESLLGKVLRIDVNGSDGGLPYAIPPDNPFVGQGPNVREEIFATGFRNPWRLSIDELTGDIWVGDVGEEEWEEINLVTAGGNYGWPIMEGPNCLLHQPCNTDGLIPPVWAYGRELGISVTGGYVYRGNDMPGLVGKYVFADWGYGNVWALDPNEDPAEPEQIAKTPFNMTSFAEDASGEFFVTRYFHGTIAKLVGPGSTSHERELPSSESVTLHPPYPNPASGRAAVQFESRRGDRVRLALFDVLGREVARLADGRVFDEGPTIVEFSTADLPSGLYILRLETQEGGVVRTLSIVR